MRIIAITTPKVDDEDVRLIRAMIGCGIDTIHLRKPDSDLDDCRRLLKELTDSEREGPAPATHLRK